jgi:hypothetical protein
VSGVNRLEVDCTAYYQVADHGTSYNFTNNFHDVSLTDELDYFFLFATRMKVTYAVTPPANTATTAVPVNTFFITLMMLSWELNYFFFLFLHSPIATVTYMPKDATTGIATATTTTPMATFLTIPMMLSLAVVTGL